jgi:hypothetical protein
MPDVDVSIDMILDKSVYSKIKNPYYDATFKNIVGYFNAGDYIGIVYSWVTRNNKIYLATYANYNDFKNFSNGKYVEWGYDNLTYPELKKELAKKQAEEKLKADQAKKEAVGAVQFYIEKYAPWIIGAIVVGIAFPSIIKTFKNDK